MMSPRLTTIHHSTTCNKTTQPATHNNNNHTTHHTTPHHTAFGYSLAIAVTMKMRQHCLVEMHMMNAENLAHVMKQQNDALTELVNSARGTSALTDIRSIARPVVFKGDENKYTEWKAKLMTYLRISTQKSDEMIQWAATADSIVIEDVVLRFAFDLDSILLSCTDDTSYGEDTSYGDHQQSRLEEARRAGEESHEGGGLVRGEVRDDDRY